MHQFARQVDFLRAELRLVASEISLVRSENNHIRGLLMALSTDVAALVAQEAESLAKEQALLDAYAGQKAAIADLSAKLAAVQPGNSLSPEDVAAIQSAVTALHASAASIEAALPAADPVAPPAAPAA